MMKFDYTIQHVPGKFLYMADAISRAPIRGTPTLDEIATEKEVEIFILCCHLTHGRKLEQIYLNYSYPIVVHY